MTKKTRNIWKVALCWLLMLTLSAQMIIPGFAAVTASGQANTGYESTNAQNTQSVSHTEPATASNATESNASEANRTETALPGAARTVMGASTSNAVKVGDFLVSGGKEGIDYKFENGVLTITSQKSLTIKNATPGNATKNTIQVAKDVSANLTLAGVNIDVSETDYASAFEIEKDSEGSVVITLADGTSNILKVGAHGVGIKKEGTNGSLTIQCEHSEKENAHECTEECGELQITVTDFGTGIGSGGCGDSTSEAVSGINITGGTVTIEVSGNGTGIGSGYSYKCNSGTVSDIRITGGIVAVKFSVGGTGIGSGFSYISTSGTVSDIRITGGTVTIKVGESGTGIGSGSSPFGTSEAVSGINITGGTVTIEVSGKGIGIGSGYAYYGTSGTTSDITITGGSVLTTSIGCTPKNGTGDTAEDVYVLTLSNPESKSVSIDGKSYSPVNHLAADENDTNLYVYLTGEAHTVRIGNTETQYTFDTDKKEFVKGTVTTCDFEITGGEEGKDYTYVGGVLTITSPKTLTIKNATPGNATKNTIQVAKDVSANLTLAGVNIDVSGMNLASAFEIEKDSEGSVVITLADGTSNILKVGAHGVGIKKEGTDGSLTIQCEHSGENGHGCTEECGELQIIAGYKGTGIGSGYNYSGGSRAVADIRIIGGIVTIEVENQGKGIGSGYSHRGKSGDVSDIRITGGIVTIKVGDIGTGIGNGKGDTFDGSIGITSDITITGGSVHAGSIGCTPDNGSGENVYLLTLSNPNSESVYIDGEEYLPVNHLAADENDTNLYVYLTGTTHTVKIGDVETHYHFNNGTFTEAIFDSSYSKDSKKHWYACTTAGCTIKKDYENHSAIEGGVCKCGYDMTAPTGKITIGAYEWDKETPSTGSGSASWKYLKENPTVTITANDNVDESVTIEYKGTDPSSNYAPYNGSFTLDHDGEYVIYARLTDQTGNQTVINTDTVVIDTTAPEIPDLINGKIYCGRQEFLINEQYDVTVTVNGNGIAVKNKKFTLDPADGEQTVVVTDLAGNETTITVTVNDGHTPTEDDGDCTTAVLCKYCDEIAVNAKEHQFSSKWEYDEYDHWHECLNEGCTVIGSKASHWENTEIRNAKKATKTREGYTGDTYCTTCGVKLADGRVTEPKETANANTNASRTENGTWTQKESGWSYVLTDGTILKSRWAYLPWSGSNQWYYFDENGRMMTGWVLLNGRWYYFHPQSDGTQGYMYTGWNLIDGRWYYFSKEKDSTEGMMFSNAVTPDGYQVGADGAWI